MVPRLRRFLAENWAYLLALAVLALLPAIVGLLTGSDPTPRRGGNESTYWQGVFIQIYIFGILAISYNLMFGFTGVLSFGHALFFGIGAYIAGIATNELGVGFGVGCVLALAVSAVLGLLTGLVSLRIKGAYFAIFTMAIAQVFFVLAKNRLLADITGAEDGFFFIVPQWLTPTPKNRLTYYYLTLLIFALVFVFVRRIINSPAGRVFLSIRENEERAQTIGYNTLAFKLLSIVFAGMLASVAGILHVVFNQRHALPGLFGATYTVDPLLASLVGGVGTFSGPAIGAAILQLGETLLRGIEFTIGGTTIQVAEYWMMVLGIIFIIVVMALPQGVVGTWMRWRARRRLDPDRD